uniref:Serpentine receptor class gamma n=1 Tax=Strongyloides venezuelensis TaxID=75913 RepID=A0A0K0FAM0_STRVS
MWSKWSIQINIIITIILPTIIFSYQFGKKDRLVYDENIDGYVYSSQTSEISRINNTIAPIFSSCILILQIILNTINIYKINFNKKNPKSIIKYNYLSKIVLYCTVSTIGITITTIRFWIKHYGAFYDSSIRNLGQTFGIFSSVISSASEPYLLLLTNKSIRYEYFKFYGKRNQIHSNT